MGSNTISIGTNANAGQSNSVAIGNGVKTTQANQVAIGTSSNTYTLAGLGGTGGGLVQADNNGNISVTTNPMLTGVTVAGTTNLQGPANFGSTGQTSIDSSGNLSVGGKAAFGSAGNQTAINGAVVKITGSSGSITLNANQDPVITVTNGQTGAALSETIVNNGFVNVIGGNTANTGTVSTLSTGNAAVQASGGAIINNGLIANGGATVNSATTLNGTTTINGAATLNGPTAVGGNFEIASGHTVNLGGGEISGVGTPILPTDAANKAYVDEGLQAANARIDKAEQGVAIAMLVQNPVLTGNDQFGITANWGQFDGNNAFGVAAAGIIARNVFGGGAGNVALTGGFGIGNGNGTSQVAGRAGLQLTW